MHDTHRDESLYGHRRKLGWADAEVDYRRSDKNGIDIQWKAQRKVSSAVTKYIQRDIRYTLRYINSYAENGKELWH